MNPNQVKVTPIPLFNEEFKRTESGFFKYSTSVKYEYSGNRKNIFVGYEIWQNGEIRQKFDGIGKSPVPHKGACAVCMNDLPRETEKTGYGLNLVLSGTDTQSGGWGQATILKPELAPDSQDYVSFRKLEKSFIMSDKEDPIIGALCIGNGANHFIGSEDFMDLVKRIEWVALIKIKFVDKTLY
ncbi:hypothetical protein JW926_01635 [Candidatus Sumerlaeota bacterium]|nr:hypothetical protein [Candidatus Sumerlaeota bacterium]